MTENQKEYEISRDNALKMLKTAKSFVVATGDGMIGFASVGLPSKNDPASTLACAVSLVEALRKMPLDALLLIQSTLENEDKARRGNPATIN